MSANPRLIMTASPDFMAAAQSELQKAVPGATWLANPAAHVAVYGLRGSFFALAAAWEERPPIFVRHIQPVQLRTELRGTMADRHIITQAVVTEYAPLLEPGLPFAVQTRVMGKRPYKPFDINRAVSDRLQSLCGALLQVRAPQQIISILITAEHAYSGLSLARHNLSDWAGGEHRFARRGDQVSRAEFKLLEAWVQFQLDVPPRSRALDLGAAPGGWTRVLRGQGCTVTAVDPGRLHPRLTADKNVRHIPLTAEAYLESGPDTYDLIVNDMRLDARDSARIMNAYARYLFRHGLAIMTLKLPGNHPLQTMEQALDILRKKYEISHARHLFHNRQEITVALRPR